MENFILPAAATPSATELSVQIEESVQSFCAITGVPVTFFSPAGEIGWECNKANKFCNYFDIYKYQQGSCMISLASAAKIAEELGEPYIFQCKAGLVKIAVSLIISGQVTGCFFAGPIVMGGLKESGIADIFSSSHIHFDSFPKAVLNLNSLKVFQPKEVTHLAHLFWNCILAAVSPNADYSGVNRQYKEQRRIGLSLQKHKKENKTMQYPYDMENQFLERVKTGDSDGALELLTELLGGISLAEEGDLPSIKTKILSICTILVRIVSDRINLTRDQTESYYFDMNDLNRAASFQELSALTANFVDNITRTIASDSYRGDSQIIHLAILYINANYQNKISLKTVANHLHTNPSYLSTLFKRETGANFTDYLNRIRINRSCELLANTNLNLTDISFQVGYDDQSYYSKVFKKLIGVTPKIYRNGLSKK